MKSSIKEKKGGSLEHSKKAALSNVTSRTKANKAQEIVTQQLKGKFEDAVVISQLLARIVETPLLPIKFFHWDESQRLDRLRETIAERINIDVKRMLANASDDIVYAIVKELTGVDAIIRLVSEVGIADVVKISPMAAAYLRGAETKRHLLEEAGGAYSTGEVAQLLGITEQAIHNRLNRNKLLAVFTGNDRNRFPTCQFTTNGVVSGFEEFLDACNVDDPWTRLALLLDPQPGLGGKSILEALPTDQRKMALRITKNFAA